MILNTFDTLTRFEFMELIIQQLLVNSKIQYIPFISLTWKGKDVCYFKLGVFIQKVFITCISEISQYARNDIANALYKKVYIHDSLTPTLPSPSIFVFMKQANESFME